MKPMRNLIILVFCGVCLLTACNKKASKEEMVVIKTEFGEMKVKLFNETPLHRDNFLKLTREGFYDGTLYHRVIKKFMIQGGDPDSKEAHEGQRLGSGGPGYTIPAEFIEGKRHHKGVLAAARQGDQVNPEKKSSGSQFYIVQGKVYSEAGLDSLEIQFNSRKRQDILRSIQLAKRGELLRLQQEGNTDKFNELLVEIEEQAEEEYNDAEKFSFSPEERKVYTTVGGTPHLDRNYTVFGEVVEGLDVLDKISSVETDQFDRPVKDIKMEIEVIE
ncbi:peptidylprolyl isomerase [Puteibacter caeruleilacunae]|nr:peptidylprolyl isomerase [Puteibacter caeruleilacunae]